MAEDEKDSIEDDEELLEDEDLDQKLKPKRFAGKKVVLIAAGVLLLLVAGAVVWLLLSGDESDSQTQTAAAGSETAEVTADDVVFYDLPEMLISLSAGDGQSYLKVRVSLELGSPAASARIESLLPRVVDNFQIYLREIRAEDLDGSAGMYRLKEELLRRINLAVAPVEVRDILFRELLIQ